MYPIFWERAPRIYAINNSVVRASIDGHSAAINSAISASSWLKNTNGTIIMTWNQATFTLNVYLGSTLLGSFTQTGANTPDPIIHFGSDSYSNTPVGTIHSIVFTQTILSGTDMTTIINEWNTEYP